MTWLWVGIGVLFGAPALAAIVLFILYFYLLHLYLGFLIRVFEEQPLFIVTPGQRPDGAEDVRFPASGGLELSGCYLRGRSASRRGIIFFGLEFGSNRWGCLPYCEFLLDAGYDVFAFEGRGQGDSDSQPGYRLSQWVTDFDVQDVKAALAYLKSRPDAVPEGAGFFGVSKGGSSGIVAAVDEPYLRCFVTDGIYATRSTMVPYMRRWVPIVSRRRWLQRVLPSWYYGLLADAGLRKTSRERGCRFPRLERALARLAPRPLLMIHGGKDTYITPEMACRLFRRAREPKQFWIVEEAKHNQAFRTAGQEYQQRILDFFDKYLPAPCGSTLESTVRETRYDADKPSSLTGNSFRQKPVRLRTETGASAEPR